MRNTRLLETVNPRYRKDISVRRYSLADMISESYSLLYDVPEDSRLKFLVESHIRDVKSNPRDLDRLSEQLCTLKYLYLLEAKGKSEEELLVPEKYYDTVEGKEDRVVVHPDTKTCDCNESESIKDDEVCDEDYNRDHQRRLHYKAQDIADRTGSKTAQDIADRTNDRDFARNTEKGRDAVATSKSIDRHKAKENPEYADKRNAMNKDAAGDSEKGDAYRRRRLRQDNAIDMSESEEPELTDDELEELAKHLETIRKDKKEEPRNKPDNSIDESHPGDCNCPECSKIKEECKESYTYNEEDDFDGNVYDQLQVSIYNDLAQIYGLSEKSISVDMEQKIGKAIRLLVEVIHEGTNGDSSYLMDSKNYSGLSNFKRVSESKAFFKTFKKMHESLKEGKALTRQESIDLYKAANSAMTQLSIELEHNPDFIESFRESTQLLSRDVDSLRKCLSRGKAPSKNTMRSLARFSESLLTESDKDIMTSEEAKDYWDKNHTSDPVLADYESFDDWKKDSKENGYIVDPDPDEDVDEVYYPNGEKVPEGSPDMDKALSYMYGTDRDKDNSSYTKEEKQKAINYWIEKTDPSPYDESVASHSDTDEEITEADDVEDEVAMDPEAEEKPADTEEFVGDDEGDVQSEEADAFDQEYADARVELHKEIAAEYNDSEDPEVVEKLEQDAEEVIDLPGTTEEQAADIQGEDDPIEEPDGDTEDDTDDANIDYSDITDDELEELKRHLKEMRLAKEAK